MPYIIARIPETIRYQRRQCVILEKFHVTFTIGSSRSRTASAAYCKASRMSYRFRSGNALMISSPAMPSATIPTTVATGMRNPGIQGTPPIWFGLTVVLMNFICFTSFSYLGSIEWCIKCTLRLLPLLFMQFICRAGHCCQIKLGRYAMRLLQAVAFAMTPLFHLSLRGVERQSNPFPFNS